MSPDYPDYSYSMTAAIAATISSNVKFMFQRDLLIDFSGMILILARHDSLIFPGREK